MADEIVVPQVVHEETHVGKVAFPATVPEGLVEYFSFPQDLFELKTKLGITDRTIKFLLAALNGRWSLTVAADLQDIAIKTGMQYAEMDAIVRDLLEKNYAKLNDRLDLYRFWIALLHVKGVEFVEE